MTTDMILMKWVEWVSCNNTKVIIGPLGTLTIHLYVLQTWIQLYYSVTCLEEWEEWMASPAEEDEVADLPTPFQEAQDLRSNFEHDVILCPAFFCLRVKRFLWCALITMAGLSAYLGEDTCKALEALTEAGSYVIKSY